MLQSLYILLDPVGYLPINSFNSKGNRQNLFNMVYKLNAFEREAKEKETKSIKVSTYAQSIGKANVKLKANEAIQRGKLSSNTIDAFLSKK